MKVLIHLGICTQSDIYSETVVITSDFLLQLVNVVNWSFVSDPLLPMSLWYSGIIFVSYTGDNGLKYNNPVDFELFCH